jgi:hypothetical protein
MRAPFGGEGAAAWVGEGRQVKNRLSMRVSENQMAATCPII